MTEDLGELDVSKIDFLAAEKWRKNVALWAILSGNRDFFAYYSPQRLKS